MSLSSISLGGMNAAMNALDQSSWRIARQAAQSMDAPAAGPTAASVGGTDPGADRSATRRTSGDPLERDVVNQLQARNAFLANLRVFQRGDEMMGALLDMKV